jgi:hypothetical protein
MNAEHADATGRASAVQPHEVRETAVTVEEMRIALARGLARPLSRYIFDFVRYQQRWWVVYGQRWIPVTDPGVLATLERPGSWISD